MEKPTAQSLVVWTSYLVSKGKTADEKGKESLANGGEITFKPRPKMLRSTGEVVAHGRHPWPEGEAPGRPHKSRLSSISHQMIHFARFRGLSCLFENLL